MDAPAVENGDDVIRGSHEYSLAAITHGREHPSLLAIVVRHPPLVTIFTPRTIGADVRNAVVYGIVTEGDTHFMVQEYLEGKTLSEPLQTGAMPLKKALSLATEIAEALAAAHAAGIIYRNLKPESLRPWRGSLSLAC